MAGKIEQSITKMEQNKGLQNKANLTMKDYVNKMQKEIAKALPQVMTPERFTRIVMSAISNNPKLAECTPTSFLGAMMTSAQLGMEVNTPLGQAYVLPYMNKGQLEAQFQLGYKGLIDLAYRSGEVEVIQAHCVYANDKFEAEYGLNPELKHIPADGDRGELVKVYAAFRTKSGGYGFEVMSIDDVKKHAEKFSKSFKSAFSPWQSNFEEMAKKTVLKRVLKYAPLKSDFARAVTSDESIHNEIVEDMTIVPNDTAFEAEYTVLDEETGEVKENE